MVCNVRVLKIEAGTEIRYLPQIYLCSVAILVAFVERNAILQVPYIHPSAKVEDVISRKHRH